MSLNIGSGINNRCDFFSMKKARSSAPEYNALFATMQKSDNQKGKAKSQYDFATMGTVRNAVIQQNAKDDIINGQQHLYEEKLTWYGIDITDNPNAHKEIVHISDEAKKKIFENVRKDFEQTGRKPKDDVSIMESFYDLKDDYVKNIDGMDKLKSSWTMSQYRRAIHSEIESKVRELDPKWDWGQPVKKEVLNQVFGKKLDVSV